MTKHMNKSVTISIKTLVSLLSLMAITGGAIAKAAVWVRGNDIAHIESLISANSQVNEKQDSTINDNRKEMLAIINDTFSRLIEQNREDTRMVIERLNAIEARLNVMSN